MVDISQLWDLCSAVSCASGPEFGTYCIWDVKSPMLKKFKLWAMWMSFHAGEFFQGNIFLMSSSASRAADPLPN